MKRKNNINNAAENSKQTSDTKEELQKELNILNLALIALLIALYSILLNINFVFAQKIEILDKINKTNFADNLDNLSDTPRKTSTLFLISICIYTVILWQEYIESVKDNSKNRDEKLIEDNYNKVIAILLFLLGTTINLNTFK